MNKIISLLFSLVGFILIYYAVFPNLMLGYLLTLGIIFLVSSGLAWMDPEERGKK